ncbi:PQQ-binding-like beta-propeller repeat protein [Tropicimonas sp. IMCC34043]|uniref:outer membrane protein assembly factor BamB family protein n=1 Tax=Tropicimonas sp. IMCC34043 TaxID=2248760 RepID=UPI000E26E991|nr:PQQ-binding-like beta-propeller repeat protein [Tropicimonas sp. IMCC34043]
MIRRHARMLALAALLPVAATAEDAVWDTFNGTLAATKYSPVTSFTPQSVGKLKQAWSIHTGDLADGSGTLPETIWSATPIYANGLIYVGTPFYRILALNPATGEQVWSFDTQTELAPLTQPGLKNRGVAYWDSGETGTCGKRIFMGTMDAHLFAVDADTGTPCADFADGGSLNVNQWNTVNDVFPFSLLQPPTIHDDTLFLGWAGMDWAFSEAPPGNVLAIDARTGALKWEASFIPEEIRPKTGTANVWASMSVDTERDLLFVPVSSPSPNFWGGNRLDPIPMATSVTALDTNTGNVVWSYQLVRHDIWDYDTNAAPTLIDIEKDGQTIPALIQTTKQGMLYVLNRETGEPIFPVEERAVAASDAEGEKAAATQPFDTWLEPTNDADAMPPVFWLADLVSLGQCSRDRETYRYEGLYTPPSETGTLAYPSTAGGMQWGGGGYDPVNQKFYVNSSVAVQLYKLIPRAEYQDKGSGAEQGYYPQKDAPYGLLLENWLNWAGMPCWSPPYGYLSAYDLRTGKLDWREPFGRVQQWGFYMPPSWGSPTIGGPAVTAGGVIFIGASMDSRVRAIDAATGKELWSDLVQAPAVATPAVFTHEGRDYVVFVAGGNPILKPEVGDQVVAYTLP